MVNLSESRSGSPELNRWPARSVPVRMYASGQRACCEIFLEVDTTLIIPPFEVRFFDLRVTRVLCEIYKSHKSYMVTPGFFGFVSPFGIGRALRRVWRPLA